MSAAKAVVIHVGDGELKKASDVAVFGFCKESEAKHNFSVKGNHE